MESEEWRLSFLVEPHMEVYFPELCNHLLGGTVGSERKVVVKYVKSL